MSFLFPTRRVDISVNKGKEEVLESIRKHTEKLQTFRLLFSQHKLFEGDVLSDRFDLIFVGRFARPYKVKVKGEITKDNTVTKLKVTTGVTSFGLVFTSLWLLVMSFFTLFSLYIFISHDQIVVLTFTLVGILLLVIGIMYNFYGYRNESVRVLNLIEEIAEGRK